VRPGPARADGPEIGDDGAMPSRDHRPIRDKDARDSLFVVHLPGGDDHDDAMAAFDPITLSPGLHLVRSGETQSRLYHRIKRGTEAPSLFVGRLDGPPKFMGMAPGSLATLRSWDDLAGGDP
jgi:hypothetical protein